MSRRLIGILLLLLVCEVMGVLLGIWFFRLFERTMPPMALSSFNMGAAHVMFMIRGAVCGLGVFLIALLAVIASPMFRSSASKLSPLSSVR